MSKVPSSELESTTITSKSSFDKLEQNIEDKHFPIYLSSLRVMTITEILGIINFYIKKS